MTTVTAGDLVLIDAGYYMLDNSYFEHILDEVGAANRSYRRQVVVERVAERAITPSYAAPARIGLLDEDGRNLLETAPVRELLQLAHVLGMEEHASSSAFRACIFGSRLPERS